MASAGKPKRLASGLLAASLVGVLLLSGCINVLAASDDEFSVRVPHPAQAQRWTTETTYEFTVDGTPYGGTYRQEHRIAGGTTAELDPYGQPYDAIRVETTTETLVENHPPEPPWFDLEIVQRPSVATLDASSLTWIQTGTTSATFRPGETTPFGDPRPEACRPELSVLDVPRFADDHQRYDHLSLYGQRLAEGQTIEAHENRTVWSYSYTARHTWQALGSSDVTLMVDGSPVTLRTIEVNHTIEAEILPTDGTAGGEPRTYSSELHDWYADGIPVPVLSRWEVPGGSSQTALLEFWRGTVPLQPRTAPSGAQLNGLHPEARQMAFAQLPSRLADLNLDLPFEEAVESLTTSPRTAVDAIQWFGEHPDAYVAQATYAKYRSESTDEWDLVFADGSDTAFALVERRVNSLGVATTAAQYFHAVSWDATWTAPPAETVRAMQVVDPQTALDVAGTFMPDDWSAFGWNLNPIHYDATDEPSLVYWAGQADRAKDRVAGPVYTAEGQWTVNEHHILGAEGRVAPWGLGMGVSCSSGLVMIDGLPI